jgi:parallel beta-helix repeat protein
MNKENKIIYESWENKPKKKRKRIIVTGMILGILFLLMIGNIYYSLREDRLTGRVIDEIEISTSQADKEIAESLADGDFESNVDLIDVADISKNVNSRIMEFDTPDGKISLEFDLLDYGNWAEDKVEDELSVEEFDIEVDESSEKYKWGYDVKLNDLNFMARIDVSASQISVIDNQTLRIGNNYISFADLTEQGYSVVVEVPVVLDEINITETNITDVNVTETNVTITNSTETNITDVNVTETNVTITNSTETNITDVNVTEINITVPSQNESETNLTITETPNNETELEESVNQTEEEPEEIIEEVVEESEEVVEEQTEESSDESETIIEEVADITGSIVRGITGFFIRGFQGITGLAIFEEEVISVYVEKNFNNLSSPNGENYKIGDMINLDPVFGILVAGDNGTATDGWIVYQCGTINQSGSFTMNQSIITDYVTNDPVPCLEIIAEDVSLDFAGFNITGSGTQTHYGVSINSSNITLKNGFIYDFTGSISSGIQIFKTSNSNITNMTLQNNKYNIHATASGTGIDYSVFSDINSIDANTHSIFLVFSNYNNFTNININDSATGGGHVGLIFSKSTGNIFRDSIIYGGSHAGSHDVRAPYYGNNDFINVTYNTSKESTNGGIINRYWYYQVKVNDSGGNNVNNAEAVVYDSNFNLFVNLSYTNASGVSNLGELKEYQSRYDLRTYEEDYTIVAYNSTNRKVHEYNVTTNDLEDVSTLLETEANPPQITTISVKKGFVSEVGYVDFNLTVDDESVVDSCWYNINNTENVTMTSYTGIEWPLHYYYNATNSSIVNNTYVVNFFCNDSFNNINNTENVSIIISELSKVTECGTLNSENTLYELQNNILDHVGTCFTISANNITLDGNGYSIDGDSIGIDSGIATSSSASSNIIVKNFLNITDFYYGIFFDEVNYSLIQNNTISNTSAGILFTGTVNSTIKGNIVNLSSYGLFLAGSNYTVVNNTIDFSSSDGMLIASTSNTLIENNSLTSNRLSAIKLSGSSNNTISNNNIWNCSTYPGGVWLSQGCITVYGTGFADSIPSNNNLFEGNKINQSGGSCDFSCGNGIWLSWGASHNVFKDMNMTNIGGFSVFLDDDGNLNNSFVNFSIESERVDSGAQLLRKWYYRAYVVNASDINYTAYNATVDIYNGIDEAAYLSLRTNDSGWTNITHITEYVNTGGTTVLYDNSILSANQDDDLWDDHSYNVTAKKNNLSDPFYIDTDKTAPVLSGTNISMSSDTSSVTAVIVWNTDDSSNSSITSSLSEIPVGNNIWRINNHSITINGLTNNTKYYFNYTSCDFSNNCNTSSGNFTTIGLADPDTTVSTGGGLSCVPNFKCVFLPCGDFVGEQDPVICPDVNNCPGPQSIEQSRTCVAGGDDDDDDDQGEDEGSFSGGDSIPKGCVSNFKCGEWGLCQAVYDLEDIIGEKVLLNGEQTRNCEDLNNCEYDKVERQECDTFKPIFAKKVIRCGEDYIEIYDEDNILISRLKLVNGIYQRLNVQMLFDEFGYCPYCYDGVKNHEEDEIDCQYSGVDCPVCSVERPLTKYNYIIVISGLIGLIIICLLFIIWYLVLVRKHKRWKKRLWRISRID